MTLALCEINRERNQQRFWCRKIELLAWCLPTWCRGRFECTHGGVLSLHTGFSACHTTRHTPHHITQPHTNTHDDTHTTQTHTTSHGRDREERQRMKQMLVDLIRVLHCHCHARVLAEKRRRKRRCKTR